MQHNRIRCSARSARGGCAAGYGPPRIGVHVLVSRRLTADGGGSAPEHQRRGRQQSDGHLHRLLGCRSARGGWHLAVVTPLPSACRERAIGVSSIKKKPLLRALVLQAHNIVHPNKWRFSSPIVAPSSHGRSTAGAMRTLADPVPPPQLPATQSPFLLLRHIR